MEFLKKKGRIAFLLLVTVLLCAAFALFAGAESATVEVTGETFATQWASAASGTTLKLTEDMSYNGAMLQLNNGRTLTLDLGGHTITVTNASIGRFINSLGDLTVKNGRILVPKGLSSVELLASQKGSLHLDDVKLENELLDLIEDKTATDFPAELVYLKESVVTMTDTYISGKARFAVQLDGGVTLTATNTTVRNTLNPPSGGDMNRAAMGIYKDNTVTFADSRIEAVYVGLLFNGQTALDKNSFTLKDSVLHVSFWKNIDGKMTGKDEDFAEKQLSSSSYNSGNVFKIYCNNSHANVTLDGSKITGISSGKGFGNYIAGNAAVKNQARVTYRNSEVYMGGWGMNAEVIFDGINYILYDNQVAYGDISVAYGVTVTPGSRAYFVPGSNLKTQYTPTKFGVATEEDLPTLTTLPTVVKAALQCGAMDQSFVSYNLGFVMTPKGSETLTVEEAYEGLRSDPRCTAARFTSTGASDTVIIGDTVLWTGIPEGGTLRLMKDMTVDYFGDFGVSKNAHIDFNGYQLSVGGIVSSIKNHTVSISSGDVYIYTSREGGGIRFLTMPGKSYGWSNGSGLTGTSALFYVAGGHLHLGYTNDAEGTDHSDKNFTIVSSVVANLSTNGRLTVKGGRYYRMLSDNFATFSLQSNSSANGTVSVQDAYFYQGVNVPVLGIQNSNLTFDISFTNCVFDGAAGYANLLKNADATRYTGCTGAVKLTGCALTQVPTSATVGDVSLVLGEGCYIAETVSDSLCAEGTAPAYAKEAYTVSAPKIKNLSLADLLAGTSGVTGTQTHTFRRIVTKDTATVTWKNGDKTLAAERWQLGATPTYTSDSQFGTYSLKETKLSTPLAADTEVQVALRTSESKVQGNLTLYSNITFNLYIKNDGFIRGISYNGRSVSFTDADKTAEGAYLFRISDIAPKDLYDSFTVSILLEGGYVYEVKTSLAKYVSSVLSQEETEAGKTLVLSLLDYVQETALHLGGANAAHPGLSAISGILTSAVEKGQYERKSWETNDKVKDPTAGNIVSAALNLASHPGFVFFLDGEKYKTAPSVTVSVNGVSKTYTVEAVAVENDGVKDMRYYIVVDSIHAASYRKDLTVSLDGETFVYNFDTYMAGFVGTVPDYADAFYTYLLAAEGYLAAMAEN